MLQMSWLQVLCEMLCASVLGVVFKLTRFEVIFECSLDVGHVDLLFSLCVSFLHGNTMDLGGVMCCQ